MKSIHASEVSKGSGFIGEQAQLGLNQSVLCVRPSKGVCAFERTKGSTCMPCVYGVGEQGKCTSV